MISDRSNDSTSMGFAPAGSATGGSTAADRTAERFAACLARNPRRALEPRDDESLASVLVLLFPTKTGGIATLLTRRTETVRDHKGQISLPGGVIDPGDGHLSVTALRETHEELGIHPGHVCLVGRLDDHRTMTGYLIRPFVGWIRYRPRVRPSPVEIAETIFMPLSRLRAPGVHQVRSVEAGGRTYETDIFQVDAHVVWGATARILRDLLFRIEELL